jgi:hypothetical protein
MDGIFRLSLVYAFLLNLVSGGVDFKLDFW